jgi:hypothetical protein
MLEGESTDPIDPIDPIIWLPSLSWIFYGDLKYVDLQPLTNQTSYFTYMTSPDLQNLLRDKLSHAIHYCCMKNVNLLLPKANNQQRKMFHP